LREILQLSEIYSQTTKNVIMWPFIWGPVCEFFPIIYCRDYRRQ
jgi:hypothetical protein